MLVVIVLLLIGGPLLLAGGGLVFLGFLLIVGIVTVIVNVISKKEDDKKREIRLKKERIGRQNQEDQRQKEREEKEKERKTTVQNIEKSKNYILLAKESKSDNYRAAAVLNAVQENIYLLQPTNVSSQVHLKGKHKVIEQKILKIDPSLFQFLVDYRTKNSHDQSLPPNSGVGSGVVNLGDGDADFTSPIFNQLGADFTPTALKLDGRNLMYLPPLERTEEYCEMAFASNPEAIKHMPTFSVFLMKLKKSDPDLVTEYIQNPDDYMHFYIKQKYHRYFENDSHSQFALDSFHKQFPKVIKELENIPGYKFCVNRFMWEECVNFIDTLPENDFHHISINKFMQGFSSYWQPLFTLDELKSYFDKREEQFDYL